MRHPVEHVKGAIWAVENLNTKNPNLQKLLQTKTFQYYEKLLRLGLSSQEYSQLEENLSKTFSGSFLILRAKVYRVLRKLVKDN